MGFSEQQKQILQDHYRNPRNKTSLSPGEESAVQANPSCGDRVALKLNMDENDKVTGILFDGEGCSICMASASILTDILKGLSLQELKEKSSKVHSIFSGDSAPEELEELGDMAAFGELLNHPVRLKCAALAWDTLDIILEKELS